MFKKALGCFSCLGSTESFYATVITRRFITILLNNQTAYFNSNLGEHSCLVIIEKAKIGTIRKVYKEYKQF